MKIQAHAKAHLEALIVRARTTGTLADAAIAADYLAKVCGGKYDDCMNALVKRYRLRYAERVCKDRPGMFISKNPGNDMLRVTWDKTIISETAIPVEVPASVLMSI